mmetsp:Transcript_62934/g.74445  ORF Transcript_62934/g.74445 Transcript_62934/m.74445 type:complete len:84 (+) Transcript_62934:371-622(+)
MTRFPCGRWTEPRNEDVMRVRYLMFERAFEWTEPQNEDVMRVRYLMFERSFEYKLGHFREGGDDSGTPEITVFAEKIQSLSLQ